MTVVTAHGARPVEPLAPENMRYKATAAREQGNCTGCVFSRQDAAVCHRAVAAALRAGLPDCDEGFIYVLVPVDERQMTIGED